MWQLGEQEYRDDWKFNWRYRFHQHDRVFKYKWFTHYECIVFNREARWDVDDRS